MSRFSLFLYTGFHFIGEGILSGILVGGLMGTLLVPFFGTLAGGATGGFVGAGLGVITTLVISAANWMSLTHDTDVHDYRCTMTKSIGWLTGGVLGSLALMFFISTAIEHNAILVEYQRDYRVNLAADLIVYGLAYVLTLLAFVIPVAVYNATSTSYYADYYVARYVANKRDELAAMRLPGTPGTTSKFIGIVAGKAAWLIPVAAALTALVNMANQSDRFRPDPVRALVEGALVGGLLMVAEIAGLSLLAVMVLRVANRLYFDEYGTHLTLDEYRYQIGMVVGLTVLVYSLIVTAVIFAPVAAIIAGSSARSYADWHYGSEEKLKRDFAVDKGKPVFVDEPKPEFTPWK